MDESASDIEEFRSIEKPDAIENNQFCSSLGIAEIVFESYYTRIAAERFRLTTPEGQIIMGQTNSSGSGGTFILHNHCQNPLYYVEGGIFSEPIQEIISAKKIVPITVEIYTHEGNWKNIGSFKIESGKVNGISVRTDIREYPFSLCPVSE